MSREFPTHEDPALFYVPIRCLLFPEPVSAGMDLGVIGGMTARARKTNEDEEPIVVEVVGASIWRICDGRHRAVSAMAGGRKLILAREKEESC